METSPARGTPEQPVVAPANSGTASQVPSSSLQQPDLTSKIQKANSPAEIRAIISQQRSAIQETLRKPDGWKPGEAKPATPPPAEVPQDQPSENQAPEETQVAEEQTAETAITDQNETPEAQEPADDISEEDDGGDGPVTPITGKRAHLRLAQDDKVGRLAASLMKRNRDMPMEEAVSRARSQLGLNNQTQAEEKVPVPESNLPKSVDETMAEIARLRAERRKANTELRFEDASDLADKVEDLLQHRFTLERQAEQQEIAEAKAYDQKFTSSESKAVDLYAFAADPESPGGKRMREIEADLKDAEDPLYYSPDKPLRIAQMVAAELHIAPRRKGAPAAPAKAAAPAPQTTPAKKQVLPGGGSRTTPPPINQPSAIETKIRNTPNTVQGLRDLRKQLGLRN